MALQDRLKTQAYSNKEGDIRWTPCPSCGGPLELADYAWDLERGIITSKQRGRRLALVGPAALDAIIDELERELGDTIPQVVIEAQRRFIRAGYYTLEEIATEELFRREIAIRGLGNLREVKWGDGKLRFRLENYCLHLVLVGLVQGFFELAFQQEGAVDWELREDGDLVVEVALKPDTAAATPGVAQSAE
jgi:hypothetical protein